MAGLTSNRDKSKNGEGDEDHFSGGGHEGGRHDGDGLIPLEGRHIPLGVLDTLGAGRKHDSQIIQREGTD